MCIHCDFKALNLSNLEDQKKAAAMFTILLNNFADAEDIFDIAKNSGQIDGGRFDNCHAAMGTLLSESELAQTIRATAVNAQMQMDSMNDTATNQLNPSLH